MINNFVQINEETSNVVTTSLKVAEVFEKRHDHVLRDIKNLDCSREFFTTHFWGATYTNRGKQYPMYEMTRDGFTFLAMSFTGKKAAQFKEDYIKAFNMMEEKLQKRPCDSYMIQDPIERAQRWIEEEKERQALAVRVSGL